MDGPQQRLADAAVAVTGGSGLLGRHVVAELVARGVPRVVVLDLKAPPESLVRRSQVRFSRCDICDAAAVRAALSSIEGGVSCVVHLAGYDLGDAPTEAGYVTTNAVGAWRVLEAAEALSIPKLVGASSIAAMGLSERTFPEALPLTEAHKLSPEGAYGCAKVAMEAFGETVSRRSGMKVAMLRPMLVIRAEKAPELLRELVANGEALTGAANESARDALQVRFDEAAAAATSSDGAGGAAGGGKDESLPPFRDWVSSRDAAAAFADAALSDAWSGYKVAYVAADDSMGCTPTSEIVERVMAERALHAERIDSARFAARPRASMVDNSACKATFGWSPRDSWPDVERLVLERPWTFEGWLDGLAPV